MQSVPLLRNLSATSTYAVGANVSPFEIWTPSTRLLNIMTIGFMPDSQEDATIPAGHTVTMYAWAKTGATWGGRRIRGNQIIPGPFALPNALPLSYEAVTGVDQWRGEITVPSSSDGGTGLAVTGTWILTVTWEPAAGESNISDDELRKIFETCKVFPGSGGTVYSSSVG